MRTHSSFTQIVLCAVVLAVAAPAFAVTEFVEMTPPAVATTAIGTTRVFAVNAGVGSSNNNVAWADSDDFNDGAAWVQAPSNENSYQSYTLVAVTPSKSWGAQRAYIVSYSPTVKLWELNFDAGDASPVWRDVTSSGGPNLTNSPSIDTTWDPVLGIVWVAILDRNNGHAWTCQISSKTSTCLWEDESCYPAANNCSSPTRPASVYSPIGLNPNGLCGSGCFTNLEVYWIGSGSSQTVNRELWDAPTFDTLPAPTSPTGTKIDFPALRAVTWGNVTRLAAAGWDGSSVGDTLQVARNTGGTGTSSWAWTNVTPSSPYENRVSYSLDAIAYVSDRSSADRIWWTDVSDSEMISCDLNGPSNTTPSCTETVHNQPTDQHSQVDVLAQSLVAQTGVVGRVFDTGSIGSTAIYLYKFESSNAQWSNLLAPRDATSSLPQSSPNWSNIWEFSSDEYYGNLVVTGVAPGTGKNAVWTSTDDGNSWTNPLLPFQGGDANGVYDANGTAYVSDGFGAGGSGANIVLVQLSGGTWSPTTPFIVPYTNFGNGNKTFADRPWMAGDRYRANYLYMTYAGVNSTGWFTYCNGTAACTSGASAWCGPFQLNASGPGCAEYPDHAGCQVVQAGDSGHTIYVMIGGDAGCTAPSGGNAVGVRSITNSSQLGGSGSSCVTPVFSSPSCVDYYREPPAASLAPTTSYNGPGSYPGWSTQISADRDSSAVAIAVASYIDVATGGACTSASPDECRADQFYASYSSGLNKWCGTSCATTATTTSMIWVNPDHTGSFPWAWEDHMYGSPVLLNYGNAAFTWMDFSGSTSDTAFYYKTAYVNAMTTGWWEWVYSGWPSGAAGNYAPGSAQSVYGDINQPTNAHLHVHTFNTWTPSGSTPSAITTIWSPLNPSL